jgi:hypothetical protein
MEVGYCEAGEMIVGGVGRRAAGDLEKRVNSFWGDASEGMEHVF